MHIARTKVALTGLAVAAVAGVPLGSTLASAASAATSNPSPTVVVSGLNNPRQLSMVGGIELLVAEAGHGGTTKVGSGHNAEYVGTSGSVSAVFYPDGASGLKPQRILTGLISGSGKSGIGAVGSDGVSAASLKGPVFVQETYAPPDELPTPLLGKQSGRLLYADPYGSLQYGANITNYERLHDPDGQGFDSNPYAVLDMGTSRLVADAAGNDVLSVQGGTVSTFHVFPNVTTGVCAKYNDPHPPFKGCNYVPTALATDAKGNVFVGGLVSEVPGEGEVTELNPTGTTVLHTWTGFTSVDGVAVGSDGSLYVSQLEAKEAHPINPMAVGVLTKVAGDGSKTNVDVPFASGVVTDGAGNVFVSAFSIAPSGGLGIPGVNTSGQVWRVRF